MPEAVEHAGDSALKRLLGQQVGFGDHSDDFAFPVNDREGADRCSRSLVAISLNEAFSLMAITWVLITSLTVAFMAGLLRRSAC